MKYRKKPVVIDAIQFIDDADIILDIQEFTGLDPLTVSYKEGKVGIIIPTLEGEHIATEGDFIIKGVKGEFYPCKPDIFEQTYEKV
jgi:hypothetical protein